MLRTTCDSITPARQPNSNIMANGYGSGYASRYGSGYGLVSGYDLDMDLDMDLDLDPYINLNLDLSRASRLAGVRSAGSCLGPVWDLSGASPLATVRSAGACQGPVWGFPAGYDAIWWGLSGTSLGLPRWLRCDQLRPVWDQSGTKW